MLMNNIEKLINEYEQKLVAAKDAFSRNNTAKSIEDIESPKDFFAICSIMSAQKKALLIESFITHIFNGVHVPSKDNRGDFCVNELYYESKMSTTNSANIMNIRQVRLYQDIDFYVCGYINELDLAQSKCFLLTKTQMTNEIMKYGSFSHGTKDENKIRTNSEYSLSIKIGSDMMKRWEDQYHCEKLYKALISDSVA